MNKQQQSQFLSMYAMVLADGIVKASELEKLYQIGSEDYKLSREEINSYVLSAGTSFVIPEDYVDRVKILYEMAEIAWADGEIDETEKQLIRRYAIRLEFLEENASVICDWLLEQVRNNTPFDKVIEQINNN